MQKARLPGVVILPVLGYAVIPAYNVCLLLPNAWKTKDLAQVPELRWAQNDLVLSLPVLASIYLGHVLSPLSWSSDLTTDANRSLSGTTPQLWP